MYQTITIEDKDFIRKLERIHYEYWGRQNMINYMCLNNFNHENHFKELWEEYLIYSKLYDSLKKQLHDTYIEPLIREGVIRQNLKWEVDFDNERVRLYDVK